MTNCEDAWKRIERRLEKRFGLPYALMSDCLIIDEEAQACTKHLPRKWAESPKLSLRSTIIHTRYRALVDFLEEVGIKDAVIKVHLTKHKAPVYYTIVNGHLILNSLGFRHGE